MCQSGHRSKWSNSKWGYVKIIAQNFNNIIYNIINYYLYIFCVFAIPRKTRYIEKDFDHFDL